MDFKPLYDAVVGGQVARVEEGVRAALVEDVPAAAILNEALIPGMTEVGRMFEAQEYYVPEMLISAKAMQAGLAILKPHLAQPGAQSGARIVMGTVKGDLHDIGKNLVIIMLEGVGFQVTDLGVDVHPERFVRAAKEGARLIGMSAMLTTTVPSMKAAIEALKGSGLRDRVKVMVGGAPLTQTGAEQLGADGYAQDAGAAVRKTRELLGHSSAPA
jgi:5-methyltetrahydrofolate--homocysteine methyltransferase